MHTNEFGRGRDLTDEKRNDQLLVKSTTRCTPNELGRNPFFDNGEKRSENPIVKKLDLRRTAFPLWIKSEVSRRIFDETQV